MKRLTLAALVFLTATAVYAHSKMDVTKPSDGTVLSTAPTEIGFAFSDKLRLTKVTATHSSGDTQSFDLDDHASFTDAFTLPMAPMGPGVYEVEWRGLGIDGHAMKGTFSFEVE